MRKLAVHRHDVLDQLLLVGLLRLTRGLRSLEVVEAIVLPLRLLLSRRCGHEVQELVTSSLLGRCRRGSKVDKVYVARRGSHRGRCCLHFGGLGGLLLALGDSLEAPGALFRGLALLGLAVVAVVSAAHTSSGLNALNEFVEPAALVLKQVERVVLHVRVDPLLHHVLVVEEALHLRSGRIRCWLLETRWQVRLPVGVDEVVVEGFERVRLARGPLVQVHRLDLRDVDAEGSVLA